VVEARGVTLDELERVRLVAAAEEGATVVAPALGQAELDAPARYSLVEVSNPQGHVVDATEA